MLFKLFSQGIMPDGSIIRHIHCIIRHICCILRISNICNILDWAGAFYLGVYLLFITALCAVLKGKVISRRKGSKKPKLSRRVFFFGSRGGFKLWTFLIYNKCMQLIDIKENAMRIYYFFPPRYALHFVIQSGISYYIMIIIGVENMHK